MYNDHPGDSKKWSLFGGGRYSEGKTCFELKKTRRFDYVLYLNMFNLIKFLIENITVVVMLRFIYENQDALLFSVSKRTKKVLKRTKMVVVDRFLGLKMPNSGGRWP